MDKKGFTGSFWAGSESRFWLAQKAVQRPQGTVTGRGKHSLASSNVGEGLEVGETGEELER